MAPSQLKILSAKLLTYGALFADWQRFKKYFLFMVALHVYKLITFVTFRPSKGRLLVTFYLANRYIDDVADADTLKDWTVEQRIEFLKRKKRFTLRSHRIRRKTGKKGRGNAARITPEDSIEHLILHYQSIAKKRGEGQEWNHDAKCILNSMLFDARRLNTGKIFSKKQLESYYHELDEEGTVRPMLRLFGEDASRFRELSMLTKLVRIYYNLRDFWIDFGKGIINIPLEDIRAYRIMLPSHQNMSESLDLWFKDQAREALRLLKLHREMLEGMPFAPFTAFVLRLMYEIPAEKFLKSVLSKPYPS